MNALKELLKKREDLCCWDDEDDPIEVLKDCIKSLKGYKNKFFGEYQSKRSSTFIETPEWIKNKKCTINPQNNDSKVFSILSNTFIIS